MSTASAAQTRKNPAHRSGGIVSWKYSTPIRNWETGVRYCIRPIVESGSRVAAMPKKISGIAVTSPQAASSAACPGPWWVKVECPWAPSTIR